MEIMKAILGWMFLIGIILFIVPMALLAFSKSILWGLFVMSLELMALALFFWAGINNKKNGK